MMGSNIPHNCLFHKFINCLIIRASCQVYPAAVVQQKTVAKRTFLLQPGKIDRYFPLLLLWFVIKNYCTTTKRFGLYECKKGPVVYVFK
jgi:hypothetical protein